MIEVRDAQVRDVLIAALTNYIEQLDGKASVENSVGAERQAACTMRQWARTRAVLRMVKREG